MYSVFERSKIQLINGFRRSERSMRRLSLVVGHRVTGPTRLPGKWFCGIFSPFPSYTMVTCFYRLGIRSMNEIYWFKSALEFRMHTSSYSRPKDVFAHVRITYALNEFPEDFRVPTLSPNKNKKKK